MRIRGKYAMTALGLYGASAAGMFWYCSRRQDKGQASCCGCVFDSLADTYDNQIGLDETLMGVKLLRWWLVRQAQGDVLEVSGGTGRNLAYYQLPHLASLTVTDVSRPMLKVAAEKYGKLAADASSSGAAHPPVRFCVSDAQHLCERQRAVESQEELPQASGVSQASTHSGSQLAVGSPSATESPPGQEGECGAVVNGRVVGGLAASCSFAPGSCDTVVDSFGLCSVPEPVMALQQMAAACKPTGRVLLLEHGRASWQWLNRFLDKHAERHLQRWGCQWNRDILQLVSEAGLEVESATRWHFGTTYVIVARPGAASCSVPSAS